jgi:hypothetical protein
MSPRSGDSAKQPRGIGIVLGLFFSFVIFAFLLLCLISGLIMGRWREVLLDSRDFAELLIPFTVGFFVLAATWRKGGWIRVKEKNGLKEDEIALRHRHYHEAVDKAEWLGKKAGWARAEDPQSAKTVKLTQRHEAAILGLRSRREELRGLKRDMCARFPEDKTLAKRLDEEYPVPEEAVPEEAARRPQVGHKDSPHNQ